MLAKWSLGNRILWQNDMSANRIFWDTHRLISTNETMFFFANRQKPCRHITTCGARSSRNSYQIRFQYIPIRFLSPSGHAVTQTSLNKYGPQGCLATRIEVNAKSLQTCQAELATHFGRRDLRAWIRKGFFDKMDWMITKALYKSCKSLKGEATDHPYFATNSTNQPLSMILWEITSRTWSGSFVPKAGSRLTPPVNQEKEGDRFFQQTL